MEIFYFPIKIFEFSFTIKKIYQFFRNHVVDAAFNVGAAVVTVEKNIIFTSFNYFNFKIQTFNSFHDFLADELFWNTNAF